MSSRIKSVAAGLALVPVMLSAQITPPPDPEPVKIMIDQQLLSEFPVSDRALAPGIESIHVQPFARRFVFDTRVADLTCEYQDADGNVVAEPAGSFVLEIDKLPIPDGGPDPNIDGDGNPIDREFVIDDQTGSLTQMVLQGGSVIDICTSGQACDDPQAVRLVCREAGTAVFGTDFDPIVADLAAGWTTSARDPPPFDVVAGDAGGTLVSLNVANQGELDVGDVSVEVGATLPAQGLACPEVVTSGTDLVFDADCLGTWTVGDLVGAQSAAIELRLLADAGAALGEMLTLQATVSAPGVDDADPANNTALADAGVVKQLELFFPEISSIPSTAIDLNNPPAMVNFSIQMDPTRGPSVLDDTVEVTLDLPDGGDVEVSSSDVDFDPVTGVWSPQVGTAELELIGTLAVNNFEPGTENFCFGVASVSGPPSTEVTISGDSETQVCLDVNGPETVDLEAGNSAPADVVAGSAGDPANLAQPFTLTNLNETIAARELEAELVVSAPADAGGVTVQGDGMITRDSANPDLWHWDVGSLPAGAVASATVFIDIPSGAADGGEVSTTLQNVGIAGDQNLVDPGIASTATTTVRREYDLESVGQRALPKTGSVTAAPSGSGPAETLVFFYQVRHAVAAASDASGVEAEVLVSAPGGATLPAGTVVLEELDVPPGDSAVLDGLGADWTVGPIVNSGGVAPVAEVVVSVFEGVGDGAEVCMVGAIAAVAAGETDVNVANDASGEVCVPIVDNSAP